MRTVINKLITEEDLYGAVDAAFSQGWRRIKLYFLDRPAHRARRGRARHRRARGALRRDRPALPEVGHGGGLGGRLRAQAAHPFQWFGQDTVAELERKVALLRDAARRTRGLTIRWHEPAASVAEGLASRGDRRMGAVIERVWRAGGTFQEWSERFDLSLWEAALAAEGLSVDEVCHRERAGDEALPWDHISAGLHRDFLWGDWQDALARVTRRGLPLDPVLRLRRLHRLRPGARGGVRRSRRRAAARAPARTSASGTGSRSAWSAVPPEDRAPPPPAFHQGGEGPLHQPPGRGPHVGTGVAPQQAAGGLLAGLRAPPSRQLRAGPAHRVRVPRRVPRRAPRRRPDRGRSPWPSCPRALSALLPEGIDVTGGGPGRQRRRVRSSRR